MNYNSLFNFIIVSQKFFLEERIKFLIEESKKNNFEYILIDFQKNDFCCLEKELQIIDLFSYKKKIIVKNSHLFFQKDVKEFKFLINYFEKPCSRICFYFFSAHFDFTLEVKKILSSFCNIIQIPFLYKKDFFSYLVKKTKIYNLSLTKENIIQLIEKTNYNLFYLESELNKIRIFSYSHNKLTAQELDNLVFSSLDYYIFKLINYFLDDDILSVRKIFNYLKQRNDNNTIYIINNICTRLKYLIMIKCLKIKKKSVYEILKILNFSFVKVNFLIKESYYLSFEKIKKLFLNFLELKYLIKRNLVDAEISFEFFIINYFINNKFL